MNTATPAVTMRILAHRRAPSPLTLTPLAILLAGGAMAQPQIRDPAATRRAIAGVRDLNDAHRHACTGEIPTRQPRPSHSGPAGTLLSARLVNKPFRPGKETRAAQLPQTLTTGPSPAALNMSGGPMPLQAVHHNRTSVPPAPPA